MSRIKASFILLIWLNENVGFHPSFSRHGRIKASFILLIWLNENVPLILLPTTLCSRSTLNPSLFASSLMICDFSVLVFSFPKLLSVICTAKNSFLETVNCQTVTLAIDIGFALMMSEMYDFLSIHNVMEVIICCY